LSLSLGNAHAQTTLSTGHYVDNPVISLDVNGFGVPQTVDVHFTITALEGIGACSGVGLHNNIHYVIPPWNNGAPVNYVGGTCTGQLMCGGIPIKCENPDPKIAPKLASLTQPNANQVNMKSKWIAAPFYRAPFVELPTSERAGPSTTIRLVDLTTKRVRYVKLPSLRADPRNISMIGVRQPYIIGAKTPALIAMECEQW
jgi:hypothetical protein